MSTTAEEYAVPESLHEAEERRAQLTLDVQSIQAQLGDKQRTDEEGHRLTSNEYWAWKKKAQHALNQRLVELRVVKEWIRKTKRGLVQPKEVEVSKETSLDESVGHVRQLHTVLVSLQGEEVEFSEEERIQIDAAGYFLRRVNHHPTPNQG
jgi:hypothetical protein